MLFLDFDGVLADSAYECLFLVEEIKGSLVPEEKDRFLKYRYLVNEPYGFFLLIDLIKMGEDGSGLIDKYFKTYDSLTRTDIDKLHEVFFSARENLMGASVEAWCLKNPPTHFFNELKKVSLSKSELIVVSTKNKSAIETWLDFYEFEVSEIFGNEVYRKFGNKFNIISSVKCDKSIFVDDNEVHIDGFDWGKINCTPLCATWGYNEHEIDNSNDVLRRISDDICN